MGVVTYQCRGPGTIWHLKEVIVIKQRWVRVLRRWPPSTKCSEQTLCHLPMFSAVIRSFGPPRLKRLYKIRRWNRDVGNLMNVTPAIQGYFSSNFSFRLSAVHESHSGTVQVRHTVTFNRSLPRESPKHLMLHSQINSCQFPDNLQWKREVWVSKIAVFVKRVIDCCRIVCQKWRPISAVALPLEVNRSREQRFLASTCGIWQPGLM